MSLQQQPDTGVGLAPRISVVIPTYNNCEVLKRCLDSWQTFTGHFPVEVIVVEDGCSDGTPDLLREKCATAWGQRHLRWLHENDSHELRCTNAGLRQARAPFCLAWQDDMFLQCDWFVPELVATMEAYDEIGLVCLSRGLYCWPVQTPIQRWEDLVDWSRLQSTIGPRPWNWIRLQEVDAVVRPWMVRRSCLDRVGYLDEAFVPTEWDEADLCFRLREAGWKVATHGYERSGAYTHLGSSTLGVLSDSYKQRVLKNGLLFHSRWAGRIAADARRTRRSWLRRPTARGWYATATNICRATLAHGFSTGA
jgi:GT2 family glycosyltransferase